MSDKLLKQILKMNHIEIYHEINVKLNIPINNFSLNSYIKSYSVNNSF